jgi:tetratricopeptide (TPR) repeat protein
MGEQASATSTTPSVGPGRRNGLLIVFFAAAGALVWLWWTCVNRPDISFLPGRGSAEWIRYPTPAQGSSHPRIELNTAFRYRFTLSQVPRQASLRVAGFRRYAIALNGIQLGMPAERVAIWKQPDRFEVAEQLRAGQNEIDVNVFNSNGPPCLWLTLDTGTETIVTSERWESSCAGAAWQPARSAARPMPITSGSELAGGVSTARALQSCWPVLGPLAVLSVAGWWLWCLRRRLPANARLLLLPGLAVGWVVLFANNLCALPDSYGFDASAHMAYVQYIMEHNALPLANEGYEMFQPPLYYAICAGLLKLCHLSLPQHAAVVVLRAFGMAIGLAQICLVWASLRLLFAGEEVVALWGTLFAACVPMLLYLSHYVTNEAFAAACATGCVFVCLRMLKSEALFARHYVILGCCLGLALLAKSSALLVVPAALGALLWRGFELARARPDARARFARVVGGVCLVLFVCFAVGGFHYVRMWMHFGAPLVGNWEPRLGYAYWQDEGYRTAPFFVRFGAALLHPWFSALNGFADGIYSTLFGDSLMGGTTGFVLRPPWNYELMSINYWLAALPAIAAGVGAVLAVRKFVRAPRPEWFLVLCLGFLGALALAHMTLVVPQAGGVKAFYALGALVPLCACVGWGMSWLLSLRARLQPVLVTWFSLWALSSVVALWIPHGSTRAILAQANALRGEARFPEAAAALNAGLEHEPNNLQIRSLLADTLMRLNDSDGALEQAQQVLRADPNSASARLVRGSLLEKRRQTAEALEDYRRAVELCPGGAEYWQPLARLLLEHGLFEDAARAARDGLTADPYNADLHYSLATAWQGRGETEAAAPQFLLAARLKPQWAAPRIALGNLRLAQGHIDEAVNHYQAAVALEPNDAKTRMQLGRALLLQHRFQDVTNHIGEALRIEPANAMAHCQMGIALEGLGDISGALLHYAEAVRLDPGLREAVSNLARLKEAGGTTNSH